MSGSSLSEPTPKRVKVSDKSIDRGLYRRVKDGRFEARFSADGEWRLKTLEATTLTEARKERARLVNRADDGDIVVASRVTFKALADEYLGRCEARVAVGSMAPRTLSHYRGDLERHVLPTLGHVAVQRITSEMVAALFAKKAKKLSPWSCRALLTPTSRILKLAVKKKLIAENPLSVLDTDELPKGRNKTEARTLNREQLRALIFHAPKTYRTAIVTLVYTGLRLQELLGLVWGDVSFEDGLIRVRAQLSRASRTEPARRVPLKAKGSARDITLDGDLAGVLKAHKEEAFARGRAPPEDFIFQTATGKPVYYRNLQERGINKAADAAGLNPPDKPRLSAHDLRHSYGSHLIRSGLDVVRVSRQLGHARPSVTLDVYAHEVEVAQHQDDTSAKVSAALGGLTVVDAAAVLKREGR
jgi:integrase